MHEFDRSTLINFDEFGIKETDASVTYFYFRLQIDLSLKNRGLKRIKGENRS